MWSRTLLPLLALIGLLASSLYGCTEQQTENQPPPPAQQVQPLNPGMRAYVDPVTGEYATPPAELLKPQPQPLTPSAGLIGPGAAEVQQQQMPLPGGGVMIELGDQFQAQGQAPR